MEIENKKKLMMSFKDKQFMLAQAMQTKPKTNVDVNTNTNQASTLNLPQSISNMQERKMTIIKGGVVPSLATTSIGAFSSSSSFNKQSLALSSVCALSKNTLPYIEEMSLLTKATRQYTEDNIKKGVMFFQQRYIQLHTNPKLQTQNNESTPLTPYDKYEQYELEESEEDDEDDVGDNTTTNATTNAINNHKNSQKSIIHVTKNKLTRKCLLHYMQIIEHSIIQFNNKQYQKSYETLLNNKIINSLSEYAEFLFLTNGYDKNILGDFLSKKHKPNDTGEILDSFMSCFYFNEIPFLKCFRFLFDRISLPKDTNFVLILLDKWSTYFFNSKSHSYNNAYKDINAVYLLCSSVLTVNTTTIRKDLKKINALTLDDFIRINEHVDKNESKLIYEEVKNKPINNTPLYVDLTYKRLAREVIEYTNDNVVNAVNGGDMCLQTYFDFPNETTSLPHEVMSLLNGNVFDKVDKNGNYKEKHFVFFKDNFTQIIWCKNQSKQTPFKKVIDINDIKGVYIGTGNSPLYQGNSIIIPPDEEKNYLTIVINDGKTVDFHHDKEELITTWYVTIKTLIMKHRAEVIRNKEREVNENEQQEQEFINQLWKKEIIMNNWNYYRKYIVYKQQFVFRKPSEKKDNDENVVSLKTIKDKLNLQFNREIKGSNVNINSHIKNIFTLNEIAYIFGKGIPDNLRGDIWMMLLENPTNISEALYNHYINKINKIDFANVNTTTTTEGLVNDIIQVKNHFINDITSNALCPNNIMNNAYNIVSVYLLYRPDINYNKCLVYFAFMFLLNKTSEYNSFMNLVSLSTNTALMPFLVNDINIITEKIEFFVKLLKDKESVVYDRLKSMAIATDFYFVEWFEFLFVKCFSYKVVKRIWDLFLFKGECVLYRVGLGIVNVKKEILENGMIKGIVDNLKRIGNGYEEECVMEFVEKFVDVDDRYAMWRLNRKFKEEKEFLNMKS